MTEFPHTCSCQRDGLRKKAAPKHFCWTYHGSLVVLNNSFGTLADTCQQISEVVGGAFVLSVNHLLSHGTILMFLPVMSGQHR